MILLPVLMLVSWAWPSAAYCSEAVELTAGGDPPNRVTPTWTTPRDGTGGRGDDLIKRIGCSKLVFIKRQTYDSSHFYSDFIDGCGRFGGNLCVLDLATGDLTELLPEMSKGIFGRFDLSFDAARIVFDWKASEYEGFRLYQCNVDGTGLRQLTFRPDDEDRRIAKYDQAEPGEFAEIYHHQTDDMHPCYLPDGGIVFTSSRCEYGTLCNADDQLATTVLHRIDADGSNLQRLTNSPVSEFAPSVMDDGRILYTRWEYVDKGQLGVKCLWSMNADGTSTREVYGNDVRFPPSMMHGRQVPGQANLIVMLGTPHYPQSGIGTVILVDTLRPIRTTDPMDYVTPWVDIRQEAGWNHFDFDAGRWTRHESGPLYMDPYPLSRDRFLVSHNRDRPWSDPTAYGLYLLDSRGRHRLIFDDDDYSCWQPTPLRARPRPPVAATPCDPELAGRGLAVCTVQDIYRGMENVKRGEVKWIRIMEQLPRPWSARRRWEPAADHTGLVSLNTALATKALRGVVAVHEDGSANFYVPADRNIYFEALDENFMELQRERTYVNYRPGERRSCVGCHETSHDTPPRVESLPSAVREPPAMPQPQPGDEQACRPIHYPTDVQPVLDRFCVRCHDADEPAGDLDLTGEMTERFCRSYENILRRGLVKTYAEASDWDGTEYVPAKTIGSRASRLIQQVRRRCPGNNEKLPLEDLVKLTTWVDASGIYYGSYWGRIRIEHRNHPNFRPTPTFDQAISTENPYEEWKP